MNELALYLDYRDKQVALLRAKGLSEEEIADELYDRREMDEETRADCGTLEGKMRFFNSLTKRSEEMPW